MESTSRSKSTSRSGSEVYQDVQGCCTPHQHVCSACSKNAIPTDNVVDSSNCYEVTVKYLLSQLAKGDTEKLTQHVEDESEQEPLSHYYHGGYHVLRLGDLLHQRKYFIIRKLGWDELSTQWLARDIDNKRYVSVNIYKSSEMHTLYANNLITTFKKIQEHPCDRIMKLLDHFEVTGINGTHVCTVTEVMTECLCNYMIRQKFQAAPLAAVKSIVRQILEGIHHLHVNNKIVHTSIKPESIFFKADQIYIMTLVYGAYMAFNNSSLPSSFTCNLPDRLVHFRTNISDVYPHIQTKMLLLDKEFEQLVNKKETLRINNREMKQIHDLEKWLIDDKNEYNSPDETFMNKSTDSNNTLMKRLSRYIKSKINIQPSNTQHVKKNTIKKKSKSYSTSDCSVGSKYKSSNTTNYESPSSTSSSSSIVSQISSSDLSDFENGKLISDEILNVLEVTQNQAELCSIAQDVIESSFAKLSKENLEKFEIQQSNNENFNVSKTNRSVDGDEKCTYAFYTSENKRDEMESGMKTATDENTNINDNGDAPFHDTDNLLPCENDSDRIGMRTVPDVTISENEHTDTNNTFDDEGIAKSDSLDDIKLTPEHSEHGKSHGPSVSCKSRCECYHCANVSKSCHEKEVATGSQGDSSYSTSTSTQESYSEFLLSYCKHNSLCTTYTRYVKQIGQNVSSNEDLINPKNNIQIVITDLEQARPENDETICREDIHRQYKAIELIYTKQFDMKIDIWSVACLTFELVTGDYLFNPFESKYYTIDEHHILKIIQLLSEIPPNLMENERSIRNIKALLERDRENLTSMSAKENFYRILAKSYKIPKEEAKQLVRFLIPMLRMTASKRATAEECLQSEWFRS